jgi:hypothetical protein
MNQSRCFSRSLAAVAIALMCAAASAQKLPQRIYFSRGATRARATGYLRGIKDESVFLLRAESGQHMRIEIRGRGATRGTITFPDGQQDGGPGGVVFDGALPATGDYRIRVTESSMANAWSGSFTLIITIAAKASERPRNQTRDLMRYVGKYPSELFRREVDLKSRLRRLLGASYNSFFERLHTEVPIEKDGTVLIIRGCMAHECTIEEGILAIDLDTDKLHVAIKSASYQNGFKTWTEGSGNLPGALRRAMGND